MNQKRLTGGVLTGPQQKFCEAYALEENGTQAYQLAYPDAKPNSARANAARLLTSDDIVEEIARIRWVAEEKAESAVSQLSYRKLSAAQKRDFLCRTVEAKITELPHDSDLFISVEPTEFGSRYKLPDKLAAIKLDNDLAGEGSEAEANDAFTDLLLSIRK